MPDSTDLVAVVETKVLAAIEADEAGDFTRAHQLMQQAQLALSAIPDGTREEESFSFDRESIASAVANLKRKAASACGVQSFGVRYERG